MYKLSYKFNRAPPEEFFREDEPYKEGEKSMKIIKKNFKKKSDKILNKFRSELLVYYEFFRYGEIRSLYFDNKRNKFIVKL